MWRVNEWWMTRPWKTCRWSWMKEGSNMHCVDSDMIIDLLNGVEGARDLMMAMEESGEVCVSAVSVLELTYSAGRLSQKRVAALMDLIDELVVVPLDRSAAVFAGRVGSELVRKGESIDTMDLMIGCTALSRGLTLATRNVKHFGKIPGLRTVSW